MATIYWYSATGNSFDVARRVGAALGDAELVAIPSLDGAITCNSDVVGIVFPTFADGMPLIVYDFAEKLKTAAGAYVFAITTCGGSSQSAIAELDALLKRNGDGLSYGKKLNHVDNYIIFGDSGARGAERALAAADEGLAAIIGDLLARRTTAQSPAEPRRLDFSAMGKEYTVSDACDECGLCAKLCVAGNIAVTDNGVCFGDKCDFCLACLQWCPNQAINFKQETVGRMRYTNPNVAAEDLALR